MVLDETRLADRSAPLGTEHEGISTGFLLFQDLLSKQRHNPGLELHQAAAP